MPGVTGQDEPDGRTQPGAGGDELTLLSTSWPVDPFEPQALADITGDRGPLVVVGLPGDAVEYHPGWFEEAPGSPGPMPTELPVEDGVAMGVVHRPAPDAFTVITVVRGAEVLEIAPATFDLARLIGAVPAD